MAGGYVVVDTARLAGGGAGRPSKRYRVARSEIAFELPLSRYSIADYLSLNADTISRTFSSLSAARIIERRGRFQIVVRDWPALLEKCPMSGAIVAAHGTARSQIAR